MTDRMHIFHGVGQGLFFEGNIRDYDTGMDFHYVYDCGSESKASYLNSEIRGLKTNTLDFLAISHLHKDHVCGLPELLKKTDVKRVYLPYFDAENYLNSFKLMLFINGIGFETSTYRLLTNWYTYPKNQDDRIMFVRQKESLDFLHTDTFTFLNKSVSPELFYQIEEEIRNLLLSKKCSSIEEYMKMYPDFGDLKKSYKTLFRNNQNLLSLIMVHSPVSQMGPEVVLTGDAVFDDDLNARLLCELKGQKIALQIPHHGSNQNWRTLSKSIKNRISVFVISCGAPNRHGHPSAIVIDDVLNEFKKELHLSYQGKSYIL